MTNAQTYVQQKAAASGSSFYYAFLFLPPNKRAAIVAFYAFCREVDDVTDHVNDADVAAAKLSWWRNEVKQSFAGQPSHPAMQALMPWTEQFAITANHLLAVIEGCQMDLIQTRYLDFSDLQRYCHLVSGVIGQVSAQIFGYINELTLAYADRLGLAMQLTKIIRDVGEDARMGRIYLPMQDLQQFDVKAHEIFSRTHSGRFEALMAYQAKRARSYFKEAISMLPAEDRRPQKPGLMMASIYRTLLAEIEHERFQVLHQRIGLTPLRKLWLAWKMQALGRF